MKSLGFFLVLFMLFGCAPKADNPDIRPLLDGLNAESTYEETLSKMRGQFGARGKTYRRETDYVVAPDERFGFHWSPAASDKSKFKSVIRLRAAGRVWSYYVDIYFDSNGRILSVNYESWSRVFPPSENRLEWSPNW